ILKIVYSLSLMLMLLCLGACGAPFHATRYNAATVLEIPGSIVGDGTQALLVTEEGFLFFTRNNVYAAQKQGDKWMMAFEPFSAVVGETVLRRSAKNGGDGGHPPALST
ncbi:MAG: hypothetical protein L7F78_04560, partial [Syntrophales bacterium LBB04]|nr:hypothetical protein [Syntrophales bacterium LBB04]